MKKKNKAARNRLIVFGNLSIISIIYFFSSFFTYTSNIKALKQEKLELTNKLQSLKEDAENLKVEIEKLKDPEYIARFARENFYYSKETGEYIIKIEAKEKEIIQMEEQQDSNPTILIIVIGLSILLIFIYIIRKK